MSLRGTGSANLLVSVPSAVDGKGGLGGGRADMCGPCGQRRISCGIGTTALSRSANRALSRLRKIYGMNFTNMSGLSWAYEVRRPFGLVPGDDRYAMAIVPFEVILGTNCSARSTRGSAVDRGLPWR